MQHIVIILVVVPTNNLKCILMACPVIAPRRPQARPIAVPKALAERLVMPHPNVFELQLQRIIYSEFRRAGPPVEVGSVVLALLANVVVPEDVLAEAGGAPELTVD